MRGSLIARSTGLLMLAILVAVAFRTGATGVSATDASVSIHDFAFNPGTITVSAGGSVHWSNDQAGVTHTVTADDGSFDSGRLMSGQSFDWTFATAGTIAYHCNIHPSMHGTIVITAASNATGSGTASGGPAAASGRTAMFHAGYNLVGVPGGTALGAASVFAFDPQANSYRDASAETLVGGHGYWAFFDAEAVMPLPAGSNATVTLNALAGAWQLLGNPSGTQPALVAGADQLFAFDPAAGQYLAVTMLQPGQGAWALSRSGGAITITPGGTPATPSPTPSPSPSPAPVVTVVPMQQPVRTIPVPMPQPQPMPQPFPYPRY